MANGQFDWRWTIVALGLGLAGGGSAGTYLSGTSISQVREIARDEAEREVSTHERLFSEKLSSMQDDISEIKDSLKVIKRKLGER